MAGILLPDGDQYAQWAGCGVGSFVEMDGTSDASVSGFTLSSTHRTRKTLLELTPEKARVEFTVRTSTQGQTHEMKAVREIHATPTEEPDREETVIVESDGEATVVKQSFGDFLQNNPWAESDELLRIGDRELTCRRKENRGRVAGQAFEIRMWMSDQVPGGLARFESRIGKTQVTTNVVTAFEKK